jgi:hypothetical protein
MIIIAWFLVVYSSLAIIVQLLNVLSHNRKGERVNSFISALIHILVFMFVFHYLFMGA